MVAQAAPDLAPPYLSPREREDEMRQLAKSAGGESVVYGHSVENRPLVAIRLPSVAQNEKRVMITANIHGVEFIGGLLAMEVLRACAARHPDWTKLRERAELWILPCLNPDGYARTWRHQGNASLKQLRTNARGVDLNRNFPLPAENRRGALPFTGSADPAAATYYGLHPLSEPESAALGELMRKYAFVASVNLHSTMGTLIPARTKDPEDYRTYKDLCQRFRQAQPHWRYRRLANRFLDAYTGEMEDFQHHRFGIWACCVETFPILESLKANLRAPSTFARFNPSDPQPYIRNDMPGVLAFLNHALSLPAPRRPLG